MNTNDEQGKTLAAHLFTEGDLEHGACCDCAFVSLDRDVWDSPLVRVVVGGRAYVGTPRAVVLESVAAMPAIFQLRDSDLQSPPQWMTIPGQLPPLSTLPQTPAHWARFESAGVELRGDDPRGVHLYRDGQHIGWTTHHPDGATKDEMPVVMAMARASGCSLDQAHMALRSIPKA